MPSTHGGRRSRVKATFKPTGYKFEFEDTFFVELLREDGGKTVGVFADFHDAVLFATEKAKQSHRVRSANVYTRDAQCWAWHRTACVA
jgi:hypothetical protein